ncbi:hypothetical protein DVH05_017108 [Phytophthora capsici]|nr:hypothetical protein DVH05_017108 [Phytophthora capsici]
MKTSLPTKNYHVYLNILPQAIVDPQYQEGVIRILAYRYAERLEQLGVSTVELKIIARFNSEAPAIPVRLVEENPTGYVVRVQAYVEAAGHDEPIFTSIGDETYGELNGMPVTASYPVVSPFDKSVRWLRRCPTRCTCTTSYNQLHQWRKYVQQCELRRSPSRTC